MSYSGSSARMNFARPPTMYFFTFWMQAACIGESLASIRCQYRSLCPVAPCLAAYGTSFNPANTFCKSSSSVISPGIGSCTPSNICSPRFFRPPLRSENGGRTTVAVSSQHSPFRLAIFCYWLLFCCFKLFDARIALLEKQFQIRLRCRWHRNDLCRTVWLRLGRLLVCTVERNAATVHACRQLCDVLKF